MAVAPQRLQFSSEEDMCADSKGLLRGTVNARSMTLAANPTSHIKMDVVIGSDIKNTKFIWMTQIRELRKTIHSE